MIWVILLVVFDESEHFANECLWFNASESYCKINFADYSKHKVGLGEVYASSVSIPTDGDDSSFDHQWR